MSYWFIDYLEAWNRHDGGAIAAYFAEDGVYKDVALNESNQGHGAIKAFVDRLAAEISSDFTFEPAGTPLVTDTGYALQWVMQGTNDRSSELLPATGQPFAIRGVSVGEIENGKIKVNTDYWSLAEFLTQVGLMPAPEGATA
jgi:steroid delta-isomerase-like uncharacterized protein